MTSASVPRIDWRKQVSALEPFLAKRGGVVRVLVTEDSPASTFSKLVRQLMAGGCSDRPWISVQIDARNSNTHYIGDIVAQLSHSLRLEGPLGEDKGRIVVGSNIQANEVEISNVTISSQEDDYESAKRALRRLEVVADGIEERLRTRRICLIFLNSHTFDRHTLSRFRQALWDERLAAMVDSGLLLLDLADPARCGPDWPPDADLSIELPERFDDGSLADAHTDLVKLALDEGIANADGTAEMFASTLLQSSDKVRDLYAGLARLKAARATSSSGAHPL